MSDPFAAALDALFNAPGSAAAEYWPDYGDPITGIRIIRSRSDQRARMGDGEIISDSEVIDVRISEVAAICPGDRLRVGAADADGVFLPGDYLVVTGEAVTDAENMTWTFGAETTDPF